MSKDYDGPLPPWYWGSMPAGRARKLIGLVTEIEEEEPSYLANSSLITNGFLTWFQSFAVEHAMISKGTLFSLGTGLGKTMTACGYSERLLRENKDKKVIFVCLSESLEQIVGDFLKYSDRSVIGISGEAVNINFLKYNIEKYEILVVSYQAFYSVEFCNIIIEQINNAGGFSGLILDEVHEVSQDSLINSIMSSLCKKIDYRLFLTATPLTVEPEQIIVLMNLLDNLIFPEGKDYLKPYRILDPDTFEIIDYRELKSLADNLFPHYLSWTRSELGMSGNYYPELLIIKPSYEQLKAGLNDIPTVIKGTRDSNQTKVFVQLCKSLVKQNKKGLVYASRHENSEMLNSMLLEQGIKSYVVNGETKNKRVRSVVLSEFKDNKIDVLITDLTTSLNMESDFLIFWENTNRAIQMLGRCERGFLPKDLYIYYILTRRTVELLQFRKNVYRRCKWLREALDKDKSIFEEFHQELGQFYIEAEEQQEINIMELEEANNKL